MDTDLSRNYLDEVKDLYIINYEEGKKLKNNSKRYKVHDRFEYHHVKLSFKNIIGESNETTVELIKGYRSNFDFCSKFVHLKVNSNYKMLLVHQNNGIVLYLYKKTLNKSLAPLLNQLDQRINDIYQIVKLNSHYMDFDETLLKNSIINALNNHIDVTSSVDLYNISYRFITKINPISNQKILEIHRLARNILGAGEFSEIRLLEPLNANGQHLVEKKIFSRANEKYLSSLQDEINVFSEIWDHEFVEGIQQKPISEIKDSSGKTIALVMLRYHGNGLHFLSYLKKNFHLRLSYACINNLNKGLSYLHYKNMMQPDHKFANTLYFINSDGSIKLDVADLGGIIKCDKATIRKNLENLNKISTKFFGHVDDLMNKMFGTYTFNVTSRDDYLFFKSCIRNFMDGLLPLEESIEMLYSWYEKRMVFSQAILSLGLIQCVDEQTIVNLFKERLPRLEKNSLENLVKFDETKIIDYMNAYISEGFMSQFQGATLALALSNDFRARPTLREFSNEFKSTAP